MHKGIKYLFVSVFLLICNINLVSAINYNRACGIVINNDYKIIFKFETNGGEKISDLTFDDMDEVKLPTPVKKGFKFEGWYINRELTKEYKESDITLLPYSNGCNVTKLYTNLYAKWERISSCDIPDEYDVTLKFITNSDDKFDDLTIKVGLENDKISLPIPKKDGYYFKGWYGDSEYKSLIDDKMISSDLIYTKVKTSYVDDKDCSFDKVGKLYAKFIDKDELMYMIFDTVDNNIYMINDVIGG